MLECIFINVKRLKSKAGKDFNLASFLLNGDVFKILVNDKVYSQVLKLESGSKVLCDYEFSIWSDDLKINFTNVELAS